MPLGMSETRKKMLSLEKQADDESLPLKERIDILFILLLDFPGGDSCSKSIIGRKIRNLWEKFNEEVRGCTANDYFLENIKK